MADLPNFDFDGINHYKNLIASIVANTFAGISSEIISYPLENVKTRMEMNGKQNVPRYKSMKDCIKNTMGPGFYRGLTPALLSAIPFHLLKIPFYESLKNIFTGGVEEPPILRIVCATGVTSLLVSIIATPGEAIKIRMINDLENKNFKGMLDCFGQTVQKESYRGLMKGYGIFGINNFFLSGLELASFDFVKLFLFKQGFSPESMATFFTSTIIVSLLSTCITIPLDVTKTRYMNQINGEYKNSFHCTTSIIKNEGLGYLYSGFLPYFIKRSFSNIFCFIAYEQYKMFIYPIIEYI